MSVRQSDKDLPYRDYIQFFSIHSYDKWQIKSYQKISSHGEGKTSGNERPPHRKNFDYTGDGRQWDDHSHESYHMLRQKLPHLE